MRKAILVLALALAAALPSFATTISGTLVNGGNAGISGTLYLQLSQQAAQLASGGCGGPTVVVPSVAVAITVSSGTVPSTTIIGNDCMAPSETYYIVTFKDTNGNTIFVQNWSITGSTLNVGAITPVVVPSGTYSIGTAFITNLIISGMCSYNGVNCATGNSVTSIFGRTGAIVAQTNDYSCAQVTGCGSSAAPNYPLAITGSANSGGIPCFTSSVLQQTSATFPLNYVVVGGGVGGCPTATQILPNGTQAVTQIPGDNSSLVATDAFVRNAVAGGSVGTGLTLVCATVTISLSTGSFSGGSKVTNSASCTGLNTATDAIDCTFVGDTNSVSGYGANTAGTLTLKHWMSANTINVDQMNNTSNSITAGAASVNCKGIR
jgi:hypothetical protein